jgi:hypothetical protein
MARSKMLAAGMLLVGSVVAAQTPHRIEQIAWLAGCWRMNAPGIVIEEVWLAPAGGIALGMSRTVRDGRFPQWEHLRLEIQDGRLAYVATPSGQTETRFRGVAVTDTSFRVEDPEHDFPQFIEYTLGGDSIVARAGMLEQGGRRFSLTYGRVQCPPASPASDTLYKSLVN